MAAAVGMSVEDVEDMYRLLAIGKYDERYVIPKAHAELGQRLMQQQGTCGLDFEGGPGNCGMVVPESEAANEGFMLTDEPVELDIVKMAGRRDGRRGRAVRLGAPPRREARTPTSSARCCCSTPTSSCSPPVTSCAARSAELPALAGRRTRSSASSTGGRARSPLALQQHYVETFDLHKRSASTSPSTARVTGASAGPRCCGSSASTAPPACRWRAQSCPTTCR